MSAATGISKGEFLGMGGVLSKQPEYTKISTKLPTHLCIPDLTPTVNLSQTPRQEKGE
jgi:hypothetical protein